MNNIIDNKTIATVTAAVLLVSCGSRTSRYDAEGFFESEEITVSAEETGKVLSLEVSEGETVCKGQVVAYIDSTQLYLSKLQLEKNAVSVSNNRPDVSRQLAALKQQLATAEKEQERFGRLVADGAATTKQLDDIQSQIAILKAQIEAQQSVLGNSVASIDAQSSALDIQIAQIANRLQKCTVTSPINGTILSKYLNAGEFAVTGRPIVKIADLENVYLKAYVTSAQLSDVQLGQKVKVSADFGGDNVHGYQGTVVWISAKSEFTPKSIQTVDERENLVYAIKVAVKNDGYIKLGMYGGIRY